MQPKFIQTEINREIAPIFNQMGSRINNVILSRGGYSNIKNIKKEEAAIMGLMLGIELTVGFIRQRKALEKKRTEVEKLQADVDKCCKELAGAIKSLGVAASEIQHLRKLHDDAVNYMMQYYETVKNLSDKKKISDEYLLEENEIKAVESFYMGGKQLVRLMQVDIMKSASR